MLLTRFFFILCPVPSLCPHYCILSSFSFASAGHFPPPHSPCVSSAARALASVTARVRLLSRQTSSRWKAKCGWLRMRQTLKKRRIHLLWYTDRWWLVCLPVLHLARINPIYSPTACTSQLWTVDHGWTIKQCAGACRRGGGRRKEQERGEKEVQIIKEAHAEERKTDRRV